MNRTTITRALLAAGVLATAGLAQAQTTDVPMQAGEASTFSGGVPNAATTNSPYEDSGILARSYTYSVAPPVTYSVAPSTTYIMGAAPVYTSPYPLTADRTHDTYQQGSASATTNVPGRAGEASTMTGGVPNASTNNFASGGTTILHGPLYDQFGHRVYVY
ncbi:hypothetical protein FN976_12270 [Caenimonas sedimenti]|uniref:Uncharacterized protein n=1 Tax=Caenimonas sedimenti TaxID=2596921 RepID=A0A562ZRZ3_9BURK|nr:hypothetical protein [Caenimonas sedimenti]TWO71088.1 hypothetical protein FN976_12270 [Caenimonas sedimenti]